MDGQWVDIAPRVITIAYPEQNHSDNLYVKLISSSDHNLDLPNGIV